MFHMGMESVRRTVGQGVVRVGRRPTRPLSEQEALEYLAALSVLARWVDQSDVESAS
jgi:hypothetical protein